MNLQEQIQVLIDHAPRDGKTPNVIRAIAPALTAIASQLGRSQYYLLQAAAGNWIVTTLSHRIQPNVEKIVVYAFGSPEDALTSSIAVEEHVEAIALPSTHILFQMVAIPNLDSVVFFEAGDRVNGTEVSRQNLNQLIEQCLQQYKSAIVPPDLA
ncbi:hypothetical protein H6F67_01060 [Microcoleus sp. FACHB-1515]|uniref:hypothetical protein n=1 Tax=Cyanophyceae TaxID=3028117 RepID=UPI001688D1C6|nr:hypothetical protein [Microcoleus sp. FACHB-1515]MBD2088457.1 hypothetical protein [Microcoleus sp. FACHB-1515]